jgi:exodeoxyribonuclease VII small subunit
MSESLSGKRSFENSLTELQRIVTELQSGEIPLEKTVQLYQQGVTLRRECQERLAEFERVIETLSRDDTGRPVAQTFEDSDAGGSSQVNEPELTDDDIPF